MGVVTQLVTMIVPVFALVIFLSGIRIIRPIEVGLIETLGKYTKTAFQGFHWIVPVFQTMRKVNMTERMVDIEPQTIITSDKLNLITDAIVYYKIKNAPASQYNVDNHRLQLTSLAKTTLRAVMGKMTLKEANEARAEINSKVEAILDKETDSYGVEVLRVEIQKIQPPQDVQAAMNEVVKAEQMKIAAKDIANATETKADGERRAKIMQAEGIKRSLVLEAEGRAESIEKVAKAKAEEIRLVNQSLQKNFKNEAKVWKALETTERAMAEGSKYVIDSKSNIMNVMSEASGVTIPFKDRTGGKK